MNGLILRIEESAYMRTGPCLFGAGEKSHHLRDQSRLFLIGSLRFFTLLKQLIHFCIDRIKHAKIFNILHEDNHETMEKVGSNAFRLFGIRRLFKEIQFRGTIERLIQDTAANVLLETRLHHIRWIVIPGNVLTIARGDMSRDGCRHGSTIYVSCLDIKFIYSNFVTRIVSVAPAGAAGV